MPVEWFATVFRRPPNVFDRVCAGTERCSSRRPVPAQRVARLTQNDDFSDKTVQLLKYHPRHENPATFEFSEFVLVEEARVNDFLAKSADYWYYSVFSHFGIFFTRSLKSSQAALSGACRREAKIYPKIRFGEEFFFSVGLC